MKPLRHLLLALLLATGIGTLAAAPIDINTADAATLATSIKGVGAARAEAIVAYRDQHGPFATVDDLANVKGIGSKIVEANREGLSVGAPKQ